MFVLERIMNAISLPLNSDEGVDIGRQKAEWSDGLSLNGVNNS